MLWLADNLEVVAVPVILARVLLKKKKMGTSPSTLAACACAGEMPLDDPEAWEDRRPEAHDVGAPPLDVADREAEVEEDEADAIETALGRAGDAARWPPAHPWDASVSCADEAVADGADDADAAHERRRRERAAEVEASERVFLREYRAMMVGGIQLVVRRSTEQMMAKEGGAPVVGATLSLAERARPPRVEWAYDDGGGDASIALENVISVTASPLRADLGPALSARSFIIVGDGDATLFHAPTDEIAGLCVDGLQMLVDDARKRKAEQRARKVAPKRLTAPLADASNVVA